MEEKYDLKAGSVGFGTDGDSDYEDLGEGEGEEAEEGGQDDEV